MSLPSKPLILLVHGAWHRPSHYVALTTALRSRGYEVLSPENPSAGADSAGKTHLDDAAHLRALMLPHLDAGREAVVVAHSYGGVPATEAAAGQTVAERRARGEKGGVKAVVFVASLLLLQKGVSLIDGLGARDRTPDWWKIEGDYMVTTEAATQTFYTELAASDPAEASRLASLTVPQSLATFESVAETGAAELRAKLVYVSTARDVAVVPFMQDLFCGGLGNKVQRVDLDADHSPWLKPELNEKLVGVIEDAAAAEA